MHRTRFTSRLLYTMKEFIFRNSGFHLTNHELKGLKDICVFAVNFYVKSWTSSRLGISAPKNGLQLARELLSSGDQVSLAALKKLKRHFWYLSEEAIGFSLIDDSVFKEDTRKMAQALVKPRSELPSKQVNMSYQDIKTKKISDLITKNEKKFFDILGISTNFIEDPSLWPNLPSFVAARKTVAKLRVTNDTAERGVALIQEYNGLRKKYK